jgi:hypothetical protein
MICGDVERPKERSVITYFKALSKRGISNDSDKSRNNVSGSLVL